MLFADDDSTFFADNYFETFISKLTLISKIIDGNCDSVMLPLPFPKSNMKPESLVVKAKEKESKMFLAIRQFIAQLQSIFLSKISQVIEKEQDNDVTVMGEPSCFVDAVLSLSYTLFSFLKLIMHHNRLMQRMKQKVSVSTSTALALHEIPPSLLTFRDGEGLGNFIGSIPLNLLSIMEGSASYNKENPQQQCSLIMERLQASRGGSHLSNLTPTTCEMMQLLTTLCKVIRHICIRSGSIKESSSSSSSSFNFPLRLKLLEYLLKCISYLLLPSDPVDGLSSMPAMHHQNQNKEITSMDVLISDFVKAFLKMFVDVPIGIRHALYPSLVQVAIDSFPLAKQEFIRQNIIAILMDELQRSNKATANGLLVQTSGCDYNSSFNKQAVILDNNNNNNNDDGKDQETIQLHLNPFSRILKVKLISLNLLREFICSASDFQCLFFYLLLFFFVFIDSYSSFCFSSSPFFFSLSILVHHTAAAAVYFNIHLSERTCGCKMQSF